MARECVTSSMASLDSSRIAEEREYEWHRPIQERDLLEMTAKRDSTISHRFHEDSKLLSTSLVTSDSSKPTSGREAAILSRIVDNQTGNSFHQDVAEEFVNCGATGSGLLSSSKCGSRIKSYGNIIFSTDHVINDSRQTGSSIRESRESMPTGSGICAGCQSPIYDRHYLSALGRSWHCVCLVCCDCGLPLDKQVTCYTHEGRVYCRHDYLTRFVRKYCVRCRRPIVSNEFVIRINDLFYHRECFRCCRCLDRFSPGQQFGLDDDGAVYCPADYETTLLQRPQSVSARIHQAPQRESVGSVDGSWLQSASGKAWSDELASRLTPAQQLTTHNIDHDVVSVGDACHQRTPAMTSLVDDATVGRPITARPARPKRIRTTFKYHELRLMKSYFELNHNPDNNDLKQLAIKTGLSKRVLQVWFQNARAKHRRTSAKQQQQQQQQQQDGSKTGGPITLMMTSRLKESRQSRTEPEPEVNNVYIDAMTSSRHNSSTSGISNINNINNCNNFMPIH